MSHHDLLELKERIYSLGETISEQEAFCHNLNGFLRQLYSPVQGITSRTRTPGFSSAKNYWAAPSAAARTNRTSALNL